MGNRAWAKPGQRPELTWLISLYTPSVVPAFQFLSHSLFLSESPMYLSVSVYPSALWALCVGHPWSLFPISCLTSLCFPLVCSSGAGTTCPAVAERQSPKEEQHGGFWLNISWTGSRESVSRHGPSQPALSHGGWTAGQEDPPLTCRSMNTSWT